MQPQLLILLVGYAACRRLKERGCFKNINRNGDCRFDKRLLNLAALPAYTTPTVQISDFFVDIVLLSQSLAASSGHVANYMFLERTVAT